MDSIEFREFVEETAEKGHCEKAEILEAFENVVANDSKLEKLINGLKKEWGLDND